MPLREFAPNESIPWDQILDRLAPHGYPYRKHGSIAVDDDPTRPVFVFLSERNSADYENAREFTNGLEPQRRVVMQVDPAKDDRNARLRASDTGLAVGIFFRRNLTAGQSTFTYLGRGRFVDESGGGDAVFYRFQY